MPEAWLKFSAAMPESAAPFTDKPSASQASRIAASAVLLADPATPTSDFKSPAPVTCSNAWRCSSLNRLFVSTDTCRRRLTPWPPRIASCSASTNKERSFSNISRVVNRCRPCSSER